MTPPTRFLSALPFALSLILILGSPNSSAQTIVHSTTGYDVNISIVLISIVPHTSPCTYGYNYDVKFSYVVTFTGTNPPPTMYTLQGTIGCGSTSLFFDLPNGPSSGTITTNVNAWRGIADCNTATLAILGCNQIKIQINGPGISNRTVNIPPNTLPITLVDFDAVVNGDGVQLNWITASEQNNHHFTVERSADASFFSPVLQVPGAGNSTAMLHYSAIDNAPLPGISYYRLRQTDNDGVSSLSPVVVVMMDRDRQNTLLIYPNPSDGTGIQLPTNTIGENVEIRSITGVVLYSGVLSTNNIRVPALGAGTYLLTVTDPGTGSSRECRLVRL